MLDNFKAWLRPRLSKKTILRIHLWRAKFAAWRFGYPSRKIKLIGVTGTNGKTTTCRLIGSILEQAGSKVAEATTVHFKIGRRIWKNTSKMTTISSLDLQKFLSQALRARCEYAVLEITSHALEQFRTFGFYFWGSVLTNITHDHFDYHKNFESYKNAKLKLFARHPQVSAVNMDDPSAPEFLACPASQKYSYGLGNKKAQVRASKIMPGRDRETFSLITPLGQRTVQLKIKGKFNIYNALAAASIGLGAGVSLPGIVRGLEKVRGVRGRLELIDEGQAFKVIIDYAHTPDAFEKLYEALKPIRKKRIIAVFGATGDRDRTKRPILGEIAGRHANVIILTNEDPYTENPEKIIQEVAAGIRGKKWQAEKNYFTILDRRQAIQKALTLAQTGDLVLITGKGHEEQMAVVHPKNPRLSILIPFNEQKIIRNQLKALTKSK